MSLLLKIEIQFPLNNFSLLWPIDTKLAAWNQCNHNNGIIFFFTATFYFFFLSYQHLVESLKTWFRRIAAFLVGMLIACAKSAVSQTKHKIRCYRLENKIDEVRDPILRTIILMIKEFFLFIT